MLKLTELDENPTIFVSTHQSLINDSAAATDDIYLIKYQVRFCQAKAITE